MSLAVAPRGPRKPLAKRKTSQRQRPILAPSETELLTLLAEKPLLSGEQLISLRRSYSSQTLRMLSDLERRGLISCSVPPGKPDIPVNRYYHPSNYAIRLLASREGTTPGRHARARWLSPARLTTLFNSLEHTKGSHQFFVDLTLKAREHEDETLAVWQGEAAAARRYLWHGEVKLLRPDGYGVYRKRGRELAFFLEWDSGNMGIKRHRRKFKIYHECRAAGGDGGFPAILMVTVRERVRQLNRAALQVSRSRRDLLLPLLVATREELEASGAFGCRWWDVRSQQGVALDEAPGVWTTLNKEKEEA